MRERFGISAVHLNIKHDAQDVHFISSIAIVSLEIEIERERAYTSTPMPSRCPMRVIEVRGLALIALLQLLLLLLICSGSGNVVFVHSLAMSMSAASAANKASTRRNFMIQSSTSIGSASIASSSCLLKSQPVFAAETVSDKNDIASLMDAKAILSWDGPSYK